MLRSGRPHSAQFFIQRGTHSCRLIERMWSDRSLRPRSPAKTKLGKKKCRRSVERRVGGGSEAVFLCLCNKDVGPRRRWGICIWTREGYVQQATCKNHLKFQAETAPHIFFHLHPARQTPLRRGRGKKTALRSLFTLILPGGVSGRTCI